AALEPAALAAICAEAESLIRTYSLLDPDPGLPVPEAVGRAEWTTAALGTLSGVTDELQREHEIEITLPGPLGGIARSVVGAATGAEVGVAAGYAGRRVLGQYDLSIVGPDRPPRLLFVAPNITGSSQQLGVELDPFLRWVALHETTHAIQFASAPWLRDHIGDLIRTLLASATAGLGISDLMRRLVSSPRDTISTLLKGDLARAIAGPEQAPTLDRIQAVMTVIEGHAEHVMDAAASDFVPGVEDLRRRLEERRSGRGPFEMIAGRLLGMDLKLRQYKLGKAFCDEVVRKTGLEVLNRVWDGPDALPQMAELERPDAWLERIATSSTAASAATNS
ncbi:MAG TPA: zinc-dependent metalloprotease, partial [Vicinamibacteria bacterium]